MASSQQSLDLKLAELTECSICMETLKNPKCLPCIHTFCLACLQKHGSAKKSGDEMECPLCRKVFEIPPRGYEELPNNLFIQDMLLVSGWKSATPKCDVCKDPTPAKEYCVVCDQHFCQVCTTSHGKIATTAFHRVVSLEEKESSTVLLKARPRVCEIHKNKTLEFFCYECQLVICTKCLLLSHKQHNYADLEEASTKLTGEVKKGSFPLSSCILANHNELEQLSFDIIELSDHTSETENAVIRRCEELKNLIDAQKNELLKQIEEFRNKRLKEMQTRKDDTERQLMIMASFKQYLEELTEKGSACDIARSATNLVKRTEELVTSQHEFDEKRLSSVEVNFSEASLPDDIGAGTGLVGEVIKEHVKESILMAVGLLREILQQVSHVSLERMNSRLIPTIDSTFAVSRIPSEHDDDDDDDDYIDMQSPA